VGDRVNPGGRADAGTLSRFVGRVGRIAAVAVCATVFAPSAYAYGWPLKPFNRQHPIRGYFNDPRFGSRVEPGSFHFGVDISAPDYTWVYAVAPGRAIVRGGTVRVRGAGGRIMQYWHVWPSVDSGDRIRLHQRIGQIIPGFLHVHFAEKLGLHGPFVNPLRAGALKPYSDTTAPVVAGASFRSAAGPESPRAVSGIVDLVADAYDVPPLPPPPPWQDVRLSPATISWRIVQGETEVVPWTLAVDLGAEVLPSVLFSDVYAPGTRQNKKQRLGTYLYYLDHGFDTTSLQDGPYGLEIAASDLRGNTGRATVPFTVANGARSTPG
jgi:hypothetical protein